MLFDEVLPYEIDREKTQLKNGIKSIFKLTGYENYLKHYNVLVRKSPEGLIAELLITSKNGVTVDMPILEIEPNESDTEIAAQLENNLKDILLPYSSNLKVKHFRFLILYDWLSKRKVVVFYTVKNGKEYIIPVLDLPIKFKK